MNEDVMISVRGLQFLENNGTVWKPCSGENIISVTEVIFCSMTNIWKTAANR